MQKLMVRSACISRRWGRRAWVDTRYVGSDHDSKEPINITRFVARVCKQRFRWSIIPIGERASGTTRRRFERTEEMAQWKSAHTSNHVNWLSCSMKLREARNAKRKQARQQSVLRSRKVRKEREMKRVRVFGTVRVDGKGNESAKVRTTARSRLNGAHG